MHPRLLGSLAMRWYARNVVRNTLLYLLGVVLVAGAIYAVAEGSGIGYVDGIWWAIVTLTTVGYGDIAPESVGLRILAIWVIGSGIAAVALMTAHLAAKLSVAAMADADETPGIDDDFGELETHLSEAQTRVGHLRERFRLDEHGDDRVVAAARDLVRELRAAGPLDGHGRAVERLEEAIRQQHMSDA